MIKNAKFSGCYFYMKANIQGDFQICVPLKRDSSTGIFPVEFVKFLRGSILKNIY